MTIAVQRHAEFIMQLGPRLIGRYSDGGPTLHRVDRRRGKAARVDVESGTGLIVEGLGVPEGEAARYRPTRERGVYRFKGLTKIVARLPMPGTEEAA